MHTLWDPWHIYICVTFSERYEEIVQHYSNTQNSFLVILHTLKQTYKLFHRSC